MIEILQSLDQSLFLFLNALHFSWLDQIELFLSGQIIWIPFVGYFFYYSYKYHGQKFTAYFGLFLLLSLIASDITSSYLLKNIMERLRPCREVDLKPLIYSFGQKCGGKYGFVSSHAANAFNLIFFSLQTLRFEKKYYYYFWIVPALVSYSRIYLGVHYPGDVLGGIVVGLSYAMIFSKMFNLRSKSETFPA